RSNLRRRHFAALFAALAAFVTNGACALGSRPKMRCRLAQALGPFEWRQWRFAVLAIHDLAIGHRNGLAVFTKLEYTARAQNHVLGGLRQRPGLGRRFTNGIGQDLVLEPCRESFSLVGALLFSQQLLVLVGAQ